jgi:hypothetical protein
MRSEIGKPAGNQPDDFFRSGFNGFVGYVEDRKTTALEKLASIFDLLKDG